MFDIIKNSKIFSFISYFFIFIVCISILTFGSHILLNIGRYLGTIARYVAEGNICLL